MHLCPLKWETNEKIEKNKFNYSEYNFSMCFKGHIDLKQNKWIVPIVSFIFTKGVYFKNCLECSEWDPCKQHVSPTKYSGMSPWRKTCPLYIGSSWMQFPCYRRAIKGFQYVPATWNQPHTRFVLKLRPIGSCAELGTELTSPGLNWRPTRGLWRPM